MTLSRRGEQLVSGEISVDEYHRILSDELWWPGTMKLLDALQYSPKIKIGPAELDVLRGAARGETITQTALRRGTSYYTVNWQRRSLLRKLHARTMAQAVNHAWKWGILK